MEANCALERKIEGLEDEIATLKEQLTLQDPERVVSLERESLAVAAYVLLPVALMLGLHYLIVVRLDLDVLWLRVGTAALPMIFGFMLEIIRRPRWYETVIFAVIVALAGVLGMSATMHNAFQTPVLPQGAFDRSETAEYMLSIGLAFVLGSLLAAAIRPLVKPSVRRSGDPTFMLAVFLAHNLPHGDKPVDERIAHWQKIVHSLAPAVTALLMLYTGFRRYLH